MLTLVLPWDPCAVPDNAAYRAVAGRVVLSKRGRAAKASAFGIALTQTRGRLLTGRLALSAVAYPPTLQPRDVGNLRKLLTDALEGAAYANDRQLVDERWVLGPVDRVRPRVEITITAAATARGTE
jgi:Holliday junction resolvase RusA-like endonuclease